MPAAIPRQRGEAVPVQLEPAVDLAAIGRNFAVLVSVLAKIQSRVNLVDDRLSKRSNEMLLSGALADRPPAGVRDRIFLASDQAVGSNLFYDDGTTWTLT